MRVFGHLADGLGIEVQRVLTPHAGSKQSAPAVFFEAVNEETSFSAQFFGLGVHVVHELVNKRDRNLLDLTFRVWHLADKDVAARVDSALGFDVQHSLFFCHMNWLSGT